MTPARVDPRAMREQLSLTDEADVRSVDFLRFVVRFSEALDLDIPFAEYEGLATLRGCFAYLQRCQETV